MTSAGGAARTRRTRARKAHGIVWLSVELTRDEIDAMVDRGLLATWDDDDPEAIAVALKRLVEAALDAM